MTIRILRDAGDQGGGGAAQYPLNMEQHVPQEFRSEASLQGIKDIPTLVKGYVSAQRMIGAARTVVPSANSTPAEWNEFYNKIGRPETPDKYGMPDIQVDASLKPDAQKFAAVQKMFHEAGLTPKQASSVMSYYMKSMNDNLTSTRGATETASKAEVDSLKSEWGDKFDSNVDIAKATAKKFGDEKLFNYLETSGMGNNAPLIKFLHKIGSAVLEDGDRGGGTGDIDLNGQTRAVREIDSLKTDKEFQEALGNARHPGHAAAVARWTGLFASAYPGVQSE